MINKRIILIFLFCCCIFNTATSKTFLNYFTYKKRPKIKLKGINSYGHYSGIINCSLIGINDYKVGKVFLFLDDTPFCLAKKVNAAIFRVPFKFDTTKFSNGFHQLKILAIDASINKNKTSSQIGFYVDNLPLQARLLKNEHSVLQGQTVHLRISTNKKLSNVQASFLGQNYKCYPESKDSCIYEAFIPIECEQKVGRYPVDINIQDFMANKLELKETIIVRRYKFPRQKGVTVSRNDFEKKIIKSSNIRDKLVQDALKNSPEKKLWSGVFGLPINIRWVTTHFGEIRKSNGKIRSPKWRNYIHKGVDIVNKPRSPIWAAQNGKVVVKGWYAGSGNTIIIDHGLSIFTFYYHLEDFAKINVGDYVKKGQFIGRIGTTGKSTGYHLHWELRINNIAVNPFQWTKKSFWV